MISSQQRFDCHRNNRIWHISSFQKIHSEWTLFLVSKMGCFSLGSKIWAFQKKHWMVSTLVDDMGLPGNFVDLSPYGRTMRQTLWMRSGKSCMDPRVQFWAFMSTKTINLLQKQQHTPSSCSISDSWQIFEKWLWRQVSVYWITARERLHGYRNQDMEVLYLRDKGILRYESDFYIAQLMVQNMHGNLKAKK